jgi:uncharacterized protein (TIRG00374 family)
MKKFFSIKWLLTLFFVFSAVAIGAFVIADRDEIRQVVTTVRPFYIFLALVFTAVSYIFSCLTFIEVASMVDLGLDPRYLAKAGFTATVINSLVSMPLISGYSTRFIFMHHPDVPKSKTASYVLLHTQIANMIPLILLPFSLLYMLMFGSLGRDHRTLGLQVLGLFFLLLLLNLSLLIKKARLFIIALVLKIADLFKYRIDPGKFERLENNITLSVDLLLKRPHQFVTSMLFTLMNWLFAMFALGACFNALGGYISISVLMLGYIIGATIGVASIIPGGVGVQEVSMAGIFALFGVNISQAILAAILFRLIYYIIPFGPAFYFYRKRKLEDKAVETIQ